MFGQIDEEGRIKTSGERRSRKTTHYWVVKPEDQTVQGTSLGCYSKQWTTCTFRVYLRWASSVVWSSRFFVNTKGLSQIQRSMWSQQYSAAHKSLTVAFRRRFLSTDFVRNGRLCWQVRQNTAFNWHRSQSSLTHAQFRAAASRAKIHRLPLNYSVRNHILQTVFIILPSLVKFSRQP